MSNAKKLLGKMIHNPKDNWTIADVETVARHYGFPVENTGGGSHFFIYAADPKTFIEVPVRGGKYIGEKSLQSFITFVFKNSEEAQQEVTLDTNQRRLLDRWLASPAVNAR